jgi:tetratricopeptide (TPR) repeat protein
MGDEMGRIPWSLTEGDEEILRRSGIQPSDDPAVEVGRLLEDASQSGRVAQPAHDRDTEAVAMDLLSKGQSSEALETIYHYLESGPAKDRFNPELASVNRLCGALFLWSGDPVVGGGFTLRAMEGFTSLKGRDDAEVVRLRQQLASFDEDIQNQLRVQETKGWIDKLEEESITARSTNPLFSWKNHIEHYQVHLRFEEQKIYYETFLRVAEQTPGFEWHRLKSFYFDAAKACTYGAFFEDGLRHFKILLERETDKNDGREIIGIMMGQYYGLCLRRVGMLDDAERILRMAIAQADDDQTIGKFDHNIGHCIVQLVDVLTKKDEMDEVEILLKRAITIGNRLKRSTLEIFSAAHAAKARLALSMGDVEEAEKIAGDALQVAMAHENTVGWDKAVLSIVLGEINREKGDNDAARKYALEAHEFIYSSRFDYYPLKVEIDDILSSLE